MLPRYSRPFLLILIFSLWVVTGLFLHAPPSPGQPDEKPALPRSAVGRALGIAGSPSCSAASCHGGIEPRDNHTSSNNEFTLWLNRDPHRNAYDVLDGDLGRHMGELLKIKPQEDPSCLACHVNPSTAIPRQDEKLKSLHAEDRRWGTGCESCHGPAERWLVEHTRQDWRDLAPNEKARRGMVPLDDLAAVFRNCSGCHVGSAAGNGIPARDVTHDMIAAGHPRLLFEPSTFLENLPPHWNTQRGKRWKGDRPAAKEQSKGRTWAIGQIVAASCALDLTLDRLERTPSNWPELAEFSCYACHHELQANSWRQKERKGPRVGVVPWSDWYWTGPELLAQTSGETPEWKRNSGLLRSHMQIPSKGGREEIKWRADAVRGQLDLLLADVSRSFIGEKPPSQSLLKRLADKNLFSTGDWDQAEQIFLGVHALNHDAKIKSVTELLRDETFMNSRAFPQGMNSPLSFDPGVFFPRLKTAILESR